MIENRPLDAYFTTGTSGTSLTLEWIAKLQNRNDTWFSGRLIKKCSEKGLSYENGHLDAYFTTIPLRNFTALEWIP